MNREQFYENLQLYGADISSWPADISDEALELYESSMEIRELVRNENDFESILLQREVEEPSSDLERRITLAAKPRLPETGRGNVLSDIFGFFTVPKPVLTFAFVLMFGFTLGFIYDSYAEPGETELSEYIEFDEGEYYE